MQVVLAPTGHSDGTDAVNADSTQPTTNGAGDGLGDDDREFVAVGSGVGVADKELEALAVRLALAVADCVSAAGGVIEAVEDDDGATLSDAVGE